MFFARTRSPTAKRAGAVSARARSGRRGRAPWRRRRPERARARGFGVLERVAGRDLLRRHEAALGQQLLEAGEPDLVVAHRRDIRAAGGSRARSATCRCSTARPRPSRASARTRARSHSAWNTGSSGSGSTGPKPCMPPMSCTPFMTTSPGVFGKPGADHRVARDELGELLLAPALGAGGPHRHARGSASRRSNPTRGFRCPPAARRRNRQHAARVDHRARAVGRGLVPDRRQAEHRPRVAGAQRADDHVVASAACSRARRCARPARPA